jgi:hypothetical protein
MTKILTIVVGNSTNSNPKMRLNTASAMRMFLELFSSLRIEKTREINPLIKISIPMQITKLRKVISGIKTANPPIIRAIIPLRSDPCDEVIR